MQGVALVGILCTLRRPSTPWPDCSTCTDTTDIKACMFATGVVADGHSLFAAWLELIIFPFVDALML